MVESQDNLHFLDYWRVISSRKEIVIAVFLLVVMAGVLVTFQLPKVYEASVVIQVKEETPDVALFQPERYGFDPLFLRTQFQIIQSTPVLEEVVQNLNLAETMGKAENLYGRISNQELVDWTVKMLSKRMKVQQYRDTNLIEIKMYFAKPEQRAPELAATVADEIANVFRDRNLRRSQSITENALSALQASLQEQSDRVVQLESELQDIRENDGITPMPTAATRAAGTATLLQETIRMLEVQRLRVRLEMEDKRARLEKVNSLEDDRLMDAAPWLAQDPALASLMTEKTKAEIQLHELSNAAYGQNHPEVVRVQATINEILSKITKALAGLKIGMQADFEAAEAKYKATDDMLNDAKIELVSSQGEGVQRFDRKLAELELARKIKEAMEMKLLQERVELRIPRTSIDVIQPARMPDPTNPVSPNVLLNIMLSIVVGLGAGIGLAYFIEYLDTSVKTIEDIERFLDLPVLGVIPQRVLPLVEEDADAAHAEAYRVLRTNLQSGNKIQPHETICVTSGSVGEGKSLTLFNLAYICSTFGERTLVVDSDLHRPRQHKIFGVSNRIGLANVLAGDQNLEDVILKNIHPNLDFLPSGKIESGVHGLLDTRRMHDIIATLKERYDYVFFDAPPIVGVSDASLLARVSDKVLMVIQHRKYPRALSSRAKTMIVNSGTPLLGVVLNNINISKDYSSYYYQQHYYTYPKRSGAKPSPEKQPSSGETA
jgi:polysaccharide biosynthesis transport protein